MNLLVAIIGYFLFKSLSFELHDFTNYYFGAKLFSMGEFGVQSYYPCEFNDQIARLGYSGLFGNFNPNSPFLLLFYYPFLLLSPMPAKLLFNVLSAVVFLFSFYRLNQFLKTPNWVMWVVSLVLIIPVKNNLLFGQTYLLLSSLLMEGYLAHERENKKWAAVWWFLAIALKLFPALLLVYLVAKKDFKTSKYLILACAGLGFATVILVGTDVTWFYLIKVFPLSSSGALSEAFVVNYQSWGMWMKYLFVSDPFYNPIPILPGGGVALTITNSLFYGVIAACLYAVCSQKSDNKAFGILLLAMLLLTPYGSTYSLVLVGFASILLYDSKSQFNSVLVLLLAALICIVNYRWFDGLEPAFQFVRLWCLLLLFGHTVFSEGGFKPNLKIVGFAILVLVLKLEYKPYQNEHYAIAPNALVCGYEREGNLVKLSGMNSHGETTWTEPLNGGGEALKLSEKNRGLGYFTIVRVLEREENQRKKKE